MMEQIKGETFGGASFEDMVSVMRTKEKERGSDWP